MAYQTSKIPQKHSTTRLIGRLMDADFSGIIILFRLVPYESGVGPTSLSTARTLLRTIFQDLLRRDFRHPFSWVNHKFYAASLASQQTRKPDHGTGGWSRRSVGETRRKKTRTPDLCRVKAAFRRNSLYFNGTHCRFVTR
jgi:hypothetical protein